MARRVQCSLAVAAILVLVIGGGCATRKYVQSEMRAAEDKTNERLDLIKSQVENTQRDVASQGDQITEVSTTAREALERATAAGKLAEGKLLYEMILSDDKVRFRLESAELSDEAKAELDRFAEELVPRNENVFIEVQGHTDSSGSEAYNLELGERRAESVRRYLNAEHGIPLHRMSVISYGESAPMTGNATREERAQNRRVVLVVLQ